jgi:glutathione S-transferase
MAIMAPQITLYTAHHCPFAHRVQIALRELGLPFTTILVDILAPRTAEYLAINPTGMVPALSYNGRILTESGLIAQFLVDTFGGNHLQKASSEAVGALERYETAHFVDAFTRVHSLFDAVVFATGEEQDKREKAENYVAAVVKTLEPLLADAQPFFGGSRRLTFAEVSSAHTCSCDGNICNCHVDWSAGHDRPIRASGALAAQVRAVSAFLRTHRSAHEGTPILVVDTCRSG